MVNLRAERICANFNMDLSEHKEKLMFEMGVDLKNNRLRPEGHVA